MCSLWRPFYNFRSAWGLEPRSLPQSQGLLVFHWEDSGNEVEISFRKFSNFQPSQHLHNFSVTVLSFTPKFKIAKCCSYFAIVFHHVRTRHFSIFERHTSTQPEVVLFPFLVWNRIRAYWKSRAAKITENSEGYPFPRDNYKQKSFTWL